MIWHKGIGRQLLLHMIIVSTTNVLMTMCGFIVAYAILVRVAPDLVPAVESSEASGIDYALLALFGLLGIAIAAFAALRLTRKLVEPLSSVAENARKITEGDLTARASPGDSSLSETAQLVEDFNAMAATIEKASDEISTWNAVIAHELRTPVTILVGRLQGLEDGVFEPDPALFAGLRKQAEGLARLIEDLRTISLSFGGHLHLQKQTVNVAEEMESVALVLEPRIIESGFSLEKHLPPVDAIIDPARIRQAVIALIDNALKYADCCTIRLVVNVDGDTLEIRVIDQGPGLDDELEKVAFEPFRRGKEPSGETPKGTGLGLAVVFAIVYAHAGTLTYARASEGSAFIIRLPRK